MISKAVKAKLMERLRKKSTSKYPVNIFKERLFTDQSVRYLTERYRSGEITRTNMYARLGETAGLLLMALSDGYNIIDVARAAKVTPRAVRQIILDSCKRAKALGLIPDFDDSFSKEVNRIAH
jgi:hypothetical protein